MHTARCFGLSFVTSLFVAGCFSSDEPRKPVVMVIDDGFDETASGLAGHVLASYTVRCREVTGPSIASTDDLATRRDKYLQRLKDASQACKLEPGVSAKAPLLADVGDLKERWDLAMRNDEPLVSRMSHDEYKRIEAAIDRDFREMRFHGTATAGLVTADNKGTGLVLVERDLRSAEEASEEFECIDQASLDREVEVLNDPKFREEVSLLPVASIDQDFARIMREHGVQIVNESFGSAARPALESLLKEKNCAAVDLKPMFIAQASLDRLYEEKNPAPNDVFVVQSAGNDSVEINDSTEYSPCDAGPNHVLVGSYKTQGSRSRFSNFGDCVDVYAQGENVLARLPGGWLVPLAGTSFSAPLVVRWLVATGISESPMALRQKLVGQRDQNRHLPEQIVPASLVYAPAAPSRFIATPGSIEDRHGYVFGRLGHEPSPLRRSKWLRRFPDGNTQR